MKKYFGLLLVISTLINPLYADFNERLNLGLVAGFAAGTGDIYQNPEAASMDFEVSKLHAHVTGYVQYNISKVFSARGDFSYLNGTHEMRRIGMVSYEGVDVFSATVNGMINLHRRRSFLIYWIAGGGISSGNWQIFDGIFFELRTGAGTKLVVIKGERPVRFVMEITYHHLRDSISGRTVEAPFIAFHFGGEY